MEFYVIYVFKLNSSSSLQEKFSRFLEGHLKPCLDVGCLLLGFSLHLKAS